MKRYLQRVVFCTEGELTEGKAPKRTQLDGKVLEGMQLEEMVPGVLQLKSMIRKKFQTDESEEGILYITDSEVCLRELKREGMPVAAWLHEGNREQDLSAAMYAVESPEELDMDFYEKIYRREKGIPWEILETDRCLVREMVPSDAASFYDMYKEPAICKYMKDFHGDVSGEEAYIGEYQKKYQFFDYGVWSIVLKETGQVIGRAGFSETADFIRIQMSIEKEGTAPETEEMSWKKEKIVSATEEMEEFDPPCLGYMIGVPWQGQGLALEVCRAILEYAKAQLGFDKAQLFVEESNEASVNLSKKLGFTEVGKLVDEKGRQVLRKVIEL